MRSLSLPLCAPAHARPLYPQPSLLRRAPPASLRRAAGCALTAAVLALSPWGVSAAAHAVTAAAPEAAPPAATVSSVSSPTRAAPKELSQSDVRRAELEAARKAHRAQPLSYTEFWELLTRRRVSHVTFTADGEALTATLANGSKQRVQLPYDPELWQRLVTDLRTPFDFEPESLLRHAADGAARFSTPMACIFGVAALFKMALEEPQDDFMSPKTKKAQSNTGVTLNDVAGLGEARREAEELVNYLRNASVYQKLGAHLPAGVLMVGPPGTGKTLLARAIAGEAGVPFFFAAGSEFMEMFVGVGAARVRNLWEQARLERPCIIFIDEFDAIGTARDSSMGSEETANTINQLLTEMDGFEDNEGLVVLAATNRPQVLDKALTRPGRFDRWLRIPLPDCPGRVEILHVHARGKAFAPDVDFARVARATAGWSGADLENLTNEAAIATARKGQPLISTEDLFTAIDNLRRDPQTGNMMLAVSTGAEEDSIQEMGPLTRDTITVLAASKALLAVALEGCDELQKVHLFPGGEADYKHFFLPREETLDTGVRTVAALRCELLLRCSGRAGLSLLHGAQANVSVGAIATELDVAGRIARQLVLNLGQSRTLGQVSYMDTARESFLASDAAADAQLLHRMSPRVAVTAFAECAAVVEGAEAAAMYALAMNLAPLRALVAELQERRVMSGAEVSKFLGERGVKRVSLQDVEGARAEAGRIVYPPSADSTLPPPPKPHPLKAWEVMPADTLLTMGFVDEAATGHYGASAAYVEAERERAQRLLSKS